MTDWFFRGDFATAPTNVPAMVLGLLLAFACGHLVAWIYMLTHSGLSYSRSFVNSLIVIPTIVSLVMQVLSNSQQQPQHHRFCTILGFALQFGETHGEPGKEESILMSRNRREWR